MGSGVRKNKAPSFVLLFAVVGVAVVLSLASYSYFQSVSQQIDATVREDLRRQARIEAFQVTQLLQDKIQTVATNTRTAAQAPAIINGELERGGDVVNARQHNTEEITDRYIWINKDGKTVWSSAFEMNNTEFNLYSGYDVSQRPYFSIPAQTGKPYLSPVIQSPVDKSQRMFIAYPISSNDISRSNLGNNFNGVVVASLRATNLGKLVQSHLSSDLESSLGIIDPNGVIVYTANSTFIGENLFGQKVQSLLAPAFNSQTEVDQFNDFLRASLKGGKDSKDFAGRAGPTSTITYLPILISTDKGASDGKSNHFLTLYLTAPHNIANKVGPLIDQERNLSLAVISTISGITVAFLYVVLSSNKRLERTVSDRTSSLEIANESLSTTNKELAEKSRQLESANEQLTINEKMQREFINIAAHELRTPTQAIIGFSELFELRPEEREESMKAVARNATRLERLTNDILDVTKIEGKSLTLNKEKFNISEVVSAAVDDAKRQIENGDIRLIYQEPKEILVEGDKERMAQVISNLLSNAIKFTKKGSIFVLSEEKGNEVVVSVVDNGSGIDPEIQPRLFTKFTSKSQTGTGLGLFISRSIIEAHGGKITGTNNREGAGATFTFTLPL